MNIVEFKKLILSPHADDEVLGCASVLGKDAFVYVCGVNESKFPADGTPSDERLNHLEQKFK